MELHPDCLQRSKRARRTTWGFPDVFLREKIWLIWSSRAFSNASFVWNSERSKFRIEALRRVRETNEAAVILEDFVRYQKKEPFGNIGEKRLLRKTLLGGFGALLAAFCNVEKTSQRHGNTGLKSKKRGFQRNPSKPSKARPQRPKGDKGTRPCPRGWTFKRIPMERSNLTRPSRSRTRRRIPTLRKVSCPSILIIRRL